MSIKQKICSRKFGKKSSVSKVGPCGVCGERVGCNSIQCAKCQRWVHCCCSDVPIVLGCLCRTYLGHNCPVEEKL